MTALIWFYTGAVTGTIIGFTLAAICTVSSKITREEERTALKKALDANQTGS